MLVASSFTCLSKVIFKLFFPNSATILSFGAPAYAQSLLVKPCGHIHN